MKRMSLGVIIGIILIIYWYTKDHPQLLHPQPQGSLSHAVIEAV